MVSIVRNRLNFYQVRSLIDGGLAVQAMKFENTGMKTDLPRYNQKDLFDEDCLHTYVEIVFQLKDFNQPNTLNLTLTSVGISRSAPWSEGPIV